MTHIGRKYIVTIAALLAVVSAAQSAGFSSMSLPEISRLLTLAQDAKTASEPSAAETASPMVADAANESATTPAFEVNADDMMTKVYALVSADAERPEILQALSALNLDVDDDNSALWVASDGGYQLNYCGMRPEVTAMARFADDALTDYCFFFLFPYSDISKDSVNKDQAGFSGTLLQEISDRGADVGENIFSQDLYEVVGEYKGNLVDIRLMDEPAAYQGNINSGNIEDEDIDRSGRYIIMLSVEPGSFTDADNILATL